MEPFKLAVIHRTDVVVVIPRGEVDGATAPTLEDELCRAARQGAEAVVIDLSDVDFMDLRGVDAIIRGAEEFARHGGRLTVRYPSPLESLMFDLAGDHPGLIVDDASAATGPARDERRLDLVT
jgi:anti-anti-sigma factor